MQKAMFMVLAALAAGTAQAEKWGPTWSEVTGARYTRATMHRMPAIVKSIDGRDTMGQIVKVYHDWRLSGDMQWLRALWPRVKKALEFAWVPGGWDADRDGVLEGVQHNTYDVEFYGPNPQCGIYYLGALRAAEEMAKAVGDAAFAATCRALFD